MLMNRGMFNIERSLKHGSLAYSLLTDDSPSDDSPPALQQTELQSSQVVDGRQTLEASQTIHMHMHCDRVCCSLEEFPELLYC